MVGYHSVRAAPIILPRRRKKRNKKSKKHKLSSPPRSQSSNSAVILLSACLYTKLQHCGAVSGQCATIVAGVSDFGTQLFAVVAHRSVRFCQADNKIVGRGVNCFFSLLGLAAMFELHILGVCTLYAHVPFQYRQRMSTVIDTRPLGKTTHMVTLHRQLCKGHSLLDRWSGQEARATRHA